MTIDELIAACGRANHVNHVYLVLRRKHTPRGRVVRLFGRSGPAGYICNVKDAEGGGYGVTAAFDADAVLAAVEDLA